MGGEVEVEREKKKKGEIAFVLRGKSRSKGQQR